MALRSEGSQERRKSLRSESSGQDAGEMVTVSGFLQGDPPLALGLSTRKALSVLKEQLEAVLEKHLKERKKSLTWKVKCPQGWPELGWGGREAGSPVSGMCLSPG